MKLFSSLGNILSDLVATNLVDWVLTGAITFITTRFATREFYEKNRKAVAYNILQNSLREMLRLSHTNEFPDNAKVIFVEYKGRCFRLSKKGREEIKCNFGEPIRRTIVKVGHDVSDISSCRPVNFGVLGVANQKKRPVIYNFSSGKLYMYKHGRFRELTTERKGDSYYYESFKLSSVTSDRDTMIAVPIVEAETLYGGITFDMYDLALDNPVYQVISNTDTAEIKEKKLTNNKESLSIAIKTAESLVTVYFKKKSEAQL